MECRALKAKKAAQDLALSHRQAKLEIGSAVVDWEIKQLSLLYGPLRALLDNPRPSIEK
jgi:hypothetical protein